MERMINLLEKEIEPIESDGQFPLKKTFMMDMFTELVIELPLLSKYLKHLFEEIISYLVGQSKTKAVPFSHLRQELFSPKSETN